MAPAPELPPAPAPAAPPRRSLARRLLKGTLYTLLGVLVLALLAVGFFHTGPGKSVARGLVEDALAERFDGTVTLGTLDYALFGDLTLGDLKIVDPQGRTALALDHATVALDWGSLLSGPLALDRIVVDGVVLDSAVLQPLQKAPPPPLPDALTLRELDVRHVSATLTAPDGGVTTLRDLTVHASAAFDLPARVGDLALDTFSAEVALATPDGLRASFPLSTAVTATLRGDAVQAHIGALDTTLHVELPGQPPRDLPLRGGPLDLSADPAKARLDLAGLALGPLALVRLDATLALGPDRRPAGAQALSLAGLTLSAAGVNALVGRDLLAADLQADASVAGPLDALAVTGDVKTAGGTLALRGTVDASDPTDPRYDLSLVGADLDTARLLTAPEAPLQTSLTVTLKGHGVLPGKADADLKVDLGRTTFGDRALDALSLAASAHGDRFVVDTLTLTAFGQTLALEGRLDRLTRAFTARVTTTTALADALARARAAGLLLVPLPPVTGALDLDLTAEGVLAPAGVLDVEVAGLARGPLALERLPLEHLTVKGHLDAKDLAVDLPAGPLRLGAFDTAVDFAYRDGKPQGTLTSNLSALTAPRTTLDEARLTVTVDGLDQRFELVAKDAPQRLDAHVLLTSKVDLEARAADTTLERLDLTRGAFATHLAAPVTVHVASPGPDGQQAFTLPPLRLALAGGHLAVSGAARFAPDPEHPEASRLVHVRGDLDADDLGLAALAALAGRSSRGVNGALSGHLSLDGPPDAPTASFALDVRARARRAAPLRFTASGALRDARLTSELRLASADRRDTFADAHLAVPLALAPGQPPALAPGGTLQFDLRVDERRLSDLAPYLPDGLPPGADPAATLAAHATFRGTPARPAGSFSLAVAGGLLPPGLLPGVPPRQGFTVDARLAPNPAGVALEGRLTAALEAPGPPLLDLVLDGQFGRSPLLRGGLARPWHATLRLAPLDLARVPLPEPARGVLSGTVDLLGERDDLFAHGALSAEGLHLPGAPPVAATWSFALTEDAATTALALTVAELDALRLEGTLGLSGHGLLRRLVRRAPSGPLPFDVALTLPKHAVGAWAALAPAPLPVALPGDLGGGLTVRGTTSAPVLAGDLTWDGFTTLAGTPGRLALLVEGARDRAALALELGPRAGATAAPVRFVAALSPAEILGRGPAAVTAEARADAVPLLSLVPAALATGQRLDVAGVVDWRLDALLQLARDGDLLRPDLAASRLDGALTVRDLAVALPGTERRFHDGLLRLTTALDHLGLTLALHEKDAQRDDRSLTVEGALALDTLVPRDATLTVATHRFLMTGQGPGWGLDNPEGELDLRLKVVATELLAPVKDVDVVVEHVELYAPDRFIRLHAPQYASWGDVVFLDESKLPAGQLPPKPAPPAAVPFDPSAPGLDVHLRIPEPIHVVRDPLTLTLQGGIEARLRGAALDLDGRISVIDGAINVMGWSWPLVEGAVTAHGGLDTFLAHFAFARAPHVAALRDAALDGRDHGGRVGITVELDASGAQRVSFSGVGGAWLLDAATILNTGRTTRWSMADLPASENVQFGQPDQGLINTFVQTNLRNLIFADRANGWSDPVDDHAEYGRIWNFEAERYLAGDSARLRFVTRPPTLGANRLELQYDLLFDNAPRSVVGAGARFGSDLQLGLGLFWEFWSRD